MKISAILNILLISSFLVLTSCATCSSCSDKQSNKQCDSKSCKLKKKKNN